LGFGQSSFAEMMHRRIKELAGSGAVTAEGEPVFVSQVRQVSFNAWHYSDDTVWSGLIERLFQGIDAAADADSTAEPAAADEKQKRLEADKARLVAERDEIDTRLSQSKDAGLYAGLLSLPNTVHVIKTSVGAYWRQARTRLWLLLPWILLVGIAVAAWLSLGPLLASAITALEVLLAPVLAVVAAVRHANTTIRAKVTTQQQRLQAEQKRLGQRIGELDQQLLAVNAHARLAELVRQVAAGDDYARYRGVLGLAHEHLQQLNHDLNESRKQWRRERKGPAPIERIVLYVDDLDRCPPRRVIEVLSVVHLLLALDLFVVVVAVDSRWLERSLQAYQQQLFTGPTDPTPTAAPTGSAAEVAQPRDTPRINGPSPASMSEAGLGGELDGSPLDFLDKIFQIPYGLSPMTTTGAGNLIRAGLPATVKPTPTTPPPGTDTAAAEQAPPTGARTGTPPKNAPSEVARTIPARPSGNGATPPPATRPGPSPTVQQAAAEISNLTVTPFEQDFLAGLGLILPTPRAVKKFTNLYRLTRIAHPATDLPRYLGPPRAAARTRP
jgi:hypothetical protein